MAITRLIDLQIILDKVLTVQKAAAGDNFECKSSKRGKFIFTSIELIRSIRVCCHVFYESQYWIKKKYSALVTFARLVEALAEEKFFVTYCVVESFALHTFSCFFSCDFNFDYSRSGWGQIVC